MNFKFLNKIVGEITKQSPYKIASFPLAKRLSFSAEDMVDLVCAEEIPQVGTKFLADPFVFTYKNRTVVFFEGLDQNATKGARGFIGAIDLDKNGWFIRKTATRVLDEPYHLSYPQVFSHNGRIYMAPDTSRTNEMKLWVSEGFPEKWGYYGAIPTGALLDCTMFKDSNGYLYLIGGCKADLTTRLFKVDMASLQIQEHPSSPLQVNKNIFRPAGNVLNIDSDNFRPVQEYSSYYGERIHLFKIEELTQGTYKESYVGAIKKMDWNSYQNHHISGCPVAKIAILDGSKKFVKCRFGPLTYTFPIA